MAVLLQHVDLRHHDAKIDAGGRRLDRHFEVALPRGLAGTPHDRAIDLAYRIGREAVGGVDDAADLAPARHLVIDFDQDRLGGSIGRIQVAVERVILFTGQRFGDPEQPAIRDRLADRPGQAQRAAREGIAPRRGAVEHEIAEQRFEDTPHRAEEDAAFAEDVAAVFHLQRRLEHVGRADRHRPAERDVARRPGIVLLDRVAGVDPGAVDLLALLEQTAHRRAHALRAYADDVDVVAEYGALVLHVADQLRFLPPYARAGA